MLFSFSLFVVAFMVQRYEKGVERPRVSLIFFCSPLTIGRKNTIIGKKSNMAVTISGMFGNGKTYFAGCPVVIDISGLEWPGTSPFNIVSIEVIYAGNIVGKFRADTGGQSATSFDISSALLAIWAGYDFSREVETAHEGLRLARGYQRQYRGYSLRVSTEYLASDGKFTTTSHGPFEGGFCAIGSMTERERQQALADRGDKANADVSYHEHENRRNGDASNKPTSTPERVGILSPTSWVDLDATDTISIFYPSSTTPAADGQESHAPLVLRDSQPYVDFLFVNRRGAVETCSGQTLESMGINVKVTQYSRTSRPSFNPVRSLMAIGQDGRRSWQMSSGYVTREWAEWWALEFLGGKRKQWWMRYPIGDANGTYVPVIVEPAKQDISIYDRSKQEMPHVDFTVTLALEG